MTWRRVVILGEDRAHLDFLRGLCTWFGWTIVDEHVAPRGRGAASGWVVRQFAERLAEVRAGYQGLGLLVAVDGDNVGQVGRRRDVGTACGDVGVAPPSDADELALLVPTWSIDTWALFFVRDLVIPEHRKSKSKARAMFEQPHRGFLAPGAPVEDAPRVWKRVPLEATVRGFVAGRSHPDLPSIDHARAALARGTQA